MPEKQDSRRSRGWILVVDSGKHRGRQVPLRGGATVVGRSEEAQIRIGSADVSREHCTLRPTSHGVLVEDHGSRNGTLINDERIVTQVLLAPGSTLTVGPMRFRLAKVAGGTSRFSPLPEGEQKLSDDDIASWLTDEVVPMTSDTTVVAGYSTEQPAEESAVPEAEPEPRRWVPPPSKASFDSIAQEAADIIRRHQEMLRVESEAAASTEAPQ